VVAGPPLDALVFVAPTVVAFVAPTVVAFVAPTVALPPLPLALPPLLLPPPPPPPLALLSSAPLPTVEPPQPTITTQFASKPSRRRMGYTLFYTQLPYRVSHSGRMQRSDTATRYGDRKIQRPIL
jgi:hypothetical protein